MPPLVHEVREWLSYLHFSQQSVVAGVGGEALLQDRDRPSQGHMTTAAKQGHPREAEDGCHKGSIGDASQALNATFKAT